MKSINYDEQMLMCIYNPNPGTRAGLIDELTKMRGYLSLEEAELRKHTDSAIAKLRTMTDAEYAALDLVPDFDLDGPEE